MEVDKGVCGVIRNWTDIDTLDYSPLDVKELWGLVPRLHSQSPSYKSESPTTEEFCNQIISASAKSEPAKPKLPRHHRTDDRNEQKLSQYPQSIFPQNFIVSHTILLNQHIKEMQELSTNLMETEFIQQCPPTPSIPEEKFDVSALVEKSKYNFKLGQAPPYPLVDEITKSQILTKSVIIILAQLGFDSAKKSAVHVLVDVLIEWLTKQTRVCHNLAQHDLKRNHIAYDDVLGHSFKIMGIPHVLTLSEYYIRDVVGRRDRQLAKSKHYIQAYNKKVTELSNNFKNLKLETVKVDSPQTFQPLTFSNVAEYSQNVQSGFQPLHLIDTTAAQKSPTARPGVTSIRIGPKKQKKS